jgi:hypothetical protein
MMNGRTAGRISIILAVAVAMIAAGAAILDHRSSGAPIEPRMTWEQHVERVDAALASHDLRTARELVRDAYAAAVTSGRWEPLLHVGDAQWRVEQASGFATLGKASARENFLFALFRARDQRSLDGVLQAADAFSRLGDASVVRQALVVARDLAGRDPVAHARVDVAAEELGVRLASADGPEHNNGNGRLR